MNMPVETPGDPIAGHATAMIAHLGEDPRRRACATRRSASPGDALPHRRLRIRAARRGGRRHLLRPRATAWCWCATSSSIPCASTTCCRSSAACTSPTCRATGSSACPRSRASSTCIARRLQVQERITEQVADALMQLLEPKGVWCSPRPAICAWRCAASRSSTPRPPRALCAASMRTTRPRARRFFP